MTSENQNQWTSPYLRWIVWCAFVVGWSLTLLTSQGVDWAEAIFPDKAIRCVVANSLDVLQLHTRFMPSDNTIRYTAAKSLHVAAYGCFAILSGWLGVPRRGRWLLLVLMSLHAFGTELLQNLVPRRHGCMEDVGFDHLGLYLGLLLSWKWWRDATTTTK